MALQPSERPGWRAQGEREVRQRTEVALSSAKAVIAQLTQRQQEASATAAAAAGTAAQAIARLEGAEAALFVKLDRSESSLHRVSAAERSLQQRHTALQVRRRIHTKQIHAYWIRKC